MGILRDQYTNLLKLRKIYVEAQLYWISKAISFIDEKDGDKNEYNCLFYFCKEQNCRYKAKEEIIKEKLEQL